MDTILQKQEHHILYLTLNRPKACNALNPLLLKKLHQLLQDAREDDTIHVLVLNASGQHFSAGADLHWIQEMGQQDNASNREQAQCLADVFHLLYHFPKPTLALTQGAVMGGATGLIACCDMVIAHWESYYCFSEIKLGLIPALISPYIINAIGTRHAQHYFLSAEKIMAPTAQHLGLITHVHEEDNPETLEEKGKKLATQLADYSSLATSGIKQLIHEHTRATFDKKILERTVESFIEYATSEKVQTSISSFLNRHAK